MHLLKYTVAGKQHTYDFGPLGAEMFQFVTCGGKNLFHKQPDIVGLDGAIISILEFGEASGHVESFADAMVEDLVTHKRYRADHILDEALGMNADGLPLEEMDKLIEDNKILSVDGNKFSKAKKFNSLVEVQKRTLREQKKQQPILRRNLSKRYFITTVL